jgi:hypothetical protein
MARGKSKAFPHGRSIKNPVTYEALKRSGKSKKGGFRPNRHWRMSRPGPVAEIPDRAPNDEY